MPPAPDHYEVLAIDPGASPAQIKAAYRRRSRELHPDRNPSPAATREMAALNAAYAVLSDPARREQYDLSRPNRYQRVRTAPAEPPLSGKGALQPEHRPDWYAFLGIAPWSSSAEVLEAARRLAAAIGRAGYEPGVDARLRVQLRTATEWLTTPALRDIYDGAMEGVPPPAGAHPHLHEDWYSFLGLRPAASPERIAERVSELAARLRAGSPEARALIDAWKTLRDPARRAEYDQALASAASSRR